MTGSAQHWNSDLRMSVTVDNMKGSSEMNAIIKKGISAVLLAGALVGGTAAVA